MVGNHKVSMFGCGSGSSLLLGHWWLQLKCKLATILWSGDYTVTPFVWWLLHSTVVLVTCCCFWCVLVQLVYLFGLCSCLMVVAILLVGVAPTDLILVLYRSVFM